jgi:hypothetical protein
MFTFFTCIYGKMFSQKRHFLCGFDTVSYTSFNSQHFSVKGKLMCGLELGVIIWTL